MLNVVATAGIRENEAVQCIDEVRTALAKWNIFSDEAELSSQSVERIRKHLNF